MGLPLSIDRVDKFLTFHQAVDGDLVTIRMSKIIAIQAHGATTSKIWVEGVDGGREGTNYFTVKKNMDEMLEHMANALST